MTCWVTLQHDVLTECAACHTEQCQLSVNNGKCATCVSRKVIAVNNSDSPCTECRSRALAAWCKYCNAAFCMPCTFKYNHGTSAKCDQCQKQYCADYIQNGTCFTCEMSNRGKNLQLEIEKAEKDLHTLMSDSTTATPENVNKIMDNLNEFRSMVQATQEFCASRA